MYLAEPALARAQVFAAHADDVILQAAEAEAAAQPAAQAAEEEEVEEEEGRVFSLQLCDEHALEEPRAVACGLCALKFSRTSLKKKKRYLCRFCGASVCDACSGHLVPPSGELGKPTTRGGCSRVRALVQTCERNETCTPL